MSEKVYKTPTSNEQEILKKTLEGADEMIETARSNKIWKLLREQEKRGKKNCKNL